MRVVFIGATKFGLRCLERIRYLPGCELAGIVTAPEVFTISYQPTGVRNVHHADFAEAAARFHLPCHVMKTKMSDPSLLKTITSWRPDLVLVVGWYHIVPREIRQLAPTVGLHASLLPKYRGGAPLVWAIINDEKRTGITFFIFDDGIDTGPIIAQAEEPILEADTIATLYARIESRGLQMIEEHLPRFARGEVTPFPQPNQGTTFPQRSPADGLIDWNWDARRVYNFVRAQTRPYPGAYAQFFDKHVTIWRASVAPSGVRSLAFTFPGRIRLADAPSRVLLDCGAATSVVIEEAEYRGAVLTGESLKTWFETEMNCA